MHFAGCPLECPFTAKMSVSFIPNANREVGYQVAICGFRAGFTVTVRTLSRSLTCMQRILICAHAANFIFLAIHWYRPLDLRNGGYYNVSFI